MRDLVWEMGNNVAALISRLAPDSRDHSGFYGLHGVYPAALLFKRRQAGSATEKDVTEVLTCVSSNCTEKWLSVTAELHWRHIQVIIPE